MYVLNSLSEVNNTEKDNSIDSRVPNLMAAPPTISLPPPPPPPPPSKVPPPPPPPPADLGSTTHGQRVRRRVRSFFWKPIPEEKVRGRANIWTLSMRQQHYQMDMRIIEELFGQREDTRDGQARRSKGSFRETKEEIQILDSKRGMNVGIFLKQFKRSNRAIIEDIRLGSSKLYGQEALRELLKLLPESDEIKKLRAFKGDTNKLSLADSFMYQLIQVPSFDVRIEAMVLREEFPTLCSSMSHEIDVIRLATKELMTCEELHAILHLVLQAGNIMNAGGYAGNAVGFKLSSLLSMADTKANKPGMNLLHFVALEAQKKDENLLRFPEKLQHVHSAVRISIDNIDAELQSLQRRAVSLEEKVQKDTELLEQMDLFLQQSKKALEDLTRSWLDLRKEGNVLIDFFCEDKDAFKMDECFRIFQDFCQKFQNAIKDNQEREQKEMARQRRLRELEDKRHSWAGADQDSSSFGRSSSENDVKTLSRDGLLDLLREWPSSPLGMRRSCSFKRSRHSPTAADRELHSYLEHGGTGEPVRFSSLPRSGNDPRRKSPAWLTPQPDRWEDEPGGRRNTGDVQRGRSSGSIENPDVQDDNHTFSEDSAFTRKDFDKNINRKTPSYGQMDVSVERHMLAPKPQVFDFVTHINNHNAHVAGRTEMIVTGPETVPEWRNVPALDTPPSSKSLDDKGQRGDQDSKSDSSAITASSGKEDLDNSTMSSTTCDVPLAVDCATSAKRDRVCSSDGRDSNCLVTLDNVEVDGFSESRDGITERLSDCSHNESVKQCSVTSRPKATCRDVSSTHASTKEASKPASTNETSLPTSANAPSSGPQSPENGNMVHGLHEQEKPVMAANPKRVNSRNKSTSKNSPSYSSGASLPVRTLHPSENQNIRKTVTVSKPNHPAGSLSKTEKPVCSESRRPRRDHSTPGRVQKAYQDSRRSSLPLEELKSQKVTSGSSISRWTRDLTPRAPSVRKTNPKPARVVPRPPPEEKMCRSTMRALAQAQAAAVLGSTETTTSKASLPGFARNTVSSSSRRTSNPVAAQQQAARAATPGGHDEKAQGPLRRVQSLRVPKRRVLPSETPPTSRERQRKSSGSFSDKSFHSKDSSTGRPRKPVWK